jgi:hypothetical protein
VVCLDTRNGDGPDGRLRHEMALLRLRLQSGRPANHERTGEGVVDALEIGMFARSAASLPGDEGLLILQSRAVGAAMLLVYGDQILRGLPRPRNVLGMSAYAYQEGRFVSYGLHMQR